MQVVHQPGERCCLGLPTLTIEIADNQALVLQKLTDYGAVINLGKPCAQLSIRIQQALQQLLNSPKQYQRLSKNASQCCDGKGIKRTINALKLSKVGLRRATTDDRELLFHWQSQKSVRKYSRNNHQISYEEHCNWYESAIANPKRNLFIITESWLDGSVVSVGMLRLDLLDAKYEISILTCPNHQGRGIAAKAIAAIDPAFRTMPIHATVHPDNHASQALFSKAGFTQVAEDLFILDNNA